VNSPISPLPELAASEHDKVVNDAGLGTLVHVVVPVAPELVDDPVLETVELERVEVTELEVVDELEEVSVEDELVVTDELLDTEDELDVEELETVELETVELETITTLFAAKLVFGASLSAVGLSDVLK
jgi:hypothetical protein